MKIFSAILIALALCVSQCAGAVSVTYLTTLTSTASQSASYNFGNVTVPSDGLVVVVASVRSNITTRSINTISIGGTNGTIHASSGTSVNHSIALGSREVAAGDRNITITISGSCLNGVANVYLVTGHKSATPVDADIAYYTTEQTGTLVLDYAAANGVGVYGLHRDSSGNSPTWTDATRDYVSFIGTGTRSSANRTASGAGVSQSITFTAATNSWAVVGATWESAGVTPVTRSPLLTSILMQSGLVR